MSPHLSTSNQKFSYMYGAATNNPEESMIIISSAATVMAESLSALTPLTGNTSMSEVSEAPFAEVVSDDEQDYSKYAMELYSFVPLVEARETYKAECVYECDTTPISYSRPEFIFCRVIKSIRNQLVGLTFETLKVENYEQHFTSSTMCRISYISEHGLFGNLSQHYLRVGDIVTAVNSISTHGLDAHKIATLLKDCVGQVSITVHNPNGDPQTVASTVQKPSPQSRIGISLRSNITGTKLKIGSMQASSLFAGSLLVSGHHCLEVCGHDSRCMKATTAALLLRSSANNMVTIVSKAPSRREQRAIVLCSEPQTRRSGLWRSRVLVKQQSATLISQD